MQGIVVTANTFSIYVLFLKTILDIRGFDKTASLVLSTLWSVAVDHP